MKDDYWNNIDFPGLRLTLEEYREWTRDSKVIDQWYPYHDFAGGYEHAILLEKGGYEYKLTDFNGVGGGGEIFYLVHRVKRSENQDGDGI